MDEYIEEKTTYTIDNQEYTVIARCKKDNNSCHNGIYVKIMNWETNRKIKFISLLKGKKWDLKNERHIITR